MRGVFDGEENDPAEPRRDTELTLGAGALTGLFACLLLLCALCFWLGYATGRRGHEPSQSASSQPAPAAASAPSEGSAAKPSASEQSTIAPPPDVADPLPQDSTLPTTSAQASPASVEPRQQPPAQQMIRATMPPPAQTAVQAPVQTSSPVRPALAAAATVEPAVLSTSSAVKPALASDGELMVQIAALRSSDDAAVLIGALRKHGYEVNMRREQSDGFYHVRIGPFRSRSDAEAIQKKLLGDGYNAAVQP